MSAGSELRGVIQRLHCSALVVVVVELIGLTSASTATSATENNNSRYLWNDLVAVPTAVFERAFLPSYVDFETVLQQTTLYNRTEKNATKNDQTTTGNYSSKGENLAISAECQRNLRQTLTALRTRRTWAVKMFSSWGRLPPAGMASGTLTDLGEYDQCRNSMGDWQESIESFSEKSFHPNNLRKLFITESSKEMSELACIHGLRAITLLWIITAHTLEWTSLNVYRDTFLIRGRLASARLQIIYKAFYAVETFFYLSGFLTAIVTLKYTAGQYRRFCYLEFLTLRWARLTPQLALFLLLSVGLVAGPSNSASTTTFNGPLWSAYVRPLVNACEANWWLNLLYLQNLVNTDAICAVHTWYLAADMQLHLLSLLPIVLLLTNRKLGQLVAVLLVCACTVVSGVQVFTGRLPPGHIVTSKNDFLTEDGMPSPFVAFLYQPWNHGSVFFIGLLFGVTFFQTFLRKGSKSRGKVEVKQSTKYLLWVGGTAAYLFCLYSTYPYVQGLPYYRNDENGAPNLYNLLPAMLFPLNRILWAVALTCAIWLCATGNGGHLSSLLSWSAFRPISRASYALYLTHAWVVWVALGTRRTLIPLADGWSLALHLLAVVFGSLFVGITFNVLVETPFINALEQYKRRREREVAEGDHHQRHHQLFLASPPFVDKEGQEIVLQELETGEKRSLSGEKARKEIKVIISTSLVE
ncbi:hypothetical protein TYRP_005351 [Tyrophagus putrescentiae]|nr:hypothetical protein TYRP_005351 [Tyrophagus putrescentiae]